MRAGRPDDENRLRPALTTALALTLAVALAVALPIAAQNEPPPAEPPPAQPPAEAPAAEPQAPAEPAPPPCQAPENAQFDFWIGTWEVHEWGKEDSGKRPSRNVISKVHGGCALQEEYTTADGSYSGSSINFHDRFDGRWHQTWIDTGGQPLYLVGGLEDGKMVLSDSPDDDRPWSRITWTPQPDGSVRQTWEMSRDRGATWKVAFDGRYVRAGG